MIILFKYLIGGFITLIILELLVNFAVQKEPLIWKERIICVIIWPLVIIVFLIAFFISNYSRRK